MNRRRPLVLLFTDISNSTALAEGLEPEDYADLLSEMRAALQEIMDRHDGLIIRIDGDGALCVFGYPDPVESAGKRAAAAALEFHGRVKAIGRQSGLPELSLHSGIHAGLVLVRDGDMVRGRIEVVGDATNVAARLCDAAKGGEVLISTDALGNDAQYFAMGQRRVITLPGSTRRIAAHPVQNLIVKDTAAAAPKSAGRSPLCGRAAQMDLATTWLSKPAGDAPMFFIQGEAGSGKSRLMEEIAGLAEGDGYALAHGQCEADYLTAPLQPMAQIARLLAGTMTDMGDRAVYPDTLKTNILRAVRGRRVLVLIDDWQWADDATKRMLEQIIIGAAGALRVLIASREMDAGLSDHHAQWTTALTPLTKLEAEALVLGLIPHSDPQRVRQIQMLADGNPLLIEELCYDPDLTLTHAAEVRASFRVATLVQQRLAQLPPDVVDMLELCAVIGNRIPDALIQSLIGAEGGGQSRQLLKTDLLLPDLGGDAMRFRHILVREAIYDQLPPKRRRALHRAIAGAMLGGTDLRQDWGHKEQLAHHLIACDDPIGLDYAQQAGEAAMAAGSLDKSLAQYRHAIEFLRRNPNAREARTLVRIANRYGSAVLPDPHADHLGPMNHLIAIAAQEDMRAVSGRLCYWQASLYYAMGRPKDAANLLHEPQFSALYAASKLPPELVEALHGQIAILMARHGRARLRIDRAIDDLQAREQGAYDQSLAYMHGMRAKVRGDQGDFAGAQADFGRTEFLLNGEQPPMYGSILTQKAVVALWAEDYDLCLHFAQAGLTHGDRVGSRYFVMVSRALDAYARNGVAPDAQHGTVLEESVRWFTQTQCRYTLSLVQSWSADAALRLGDADTARARAKLCLSLARTGLRWGNALAARVLAQTAPTLAEAEGALRRSYVLSRDMQSPREWAETLCTHGAVARRFGAENVARDRLVQAQDLRRHMGLAA